MKRTGTNHNAQYQAHCEARQFFKADYKGRKVSMRRFKYAEHMARCERAYRLATQVALKECDPGHPLVQVELNPEKDQLILEQAKLLREKPVDTESLRYAMQYIGGVHVKESRIRQAEKNAVTGFALSMFETYESLFLSSLQETTVSCQQAGIEHIIRQMEQSFARHGFELLKPQGERFDPEQHEAAHTALCNEEAKNMHVSAVLRPGLRLGNRLLKAALVSVYIFAESQYIHRET